MIVNCNCCNKEIKRSPSTIKKSKTGKFYCSNSCSARKNNLDKQRNQPKERKCAECDASYHYTKGHRSIYCPKCFQNKKNEHKCKTLKEVQEKLSLQGKHKSWKNASVRNFCRSWNKELTKKPCQKCGYNKHVELCHIKAVSEFDEKTTLAEVNSPENILVLCRNCHWEFDNGILLKEEIPNRKE